jgi:hypothetical protein
MFSQETIRVKGAFVDEHSPTGISAAIHYGRSRVFSSCAPFADAARLVTKH